MISNLSFLQWFQDVRGGVRDHLGIHNTGMRHLSNKRAEHALVYENNICHIYGFVSDFQTPEQGCGSALIECEYRYES
jgi:hypothetical protein